MQQLSDAQDYVGGANGWLDIYGMMGLSKLRFYNDDLKRELLARKPFAEIGINREKMLRWHPFHRAIMLGARIMLAGHLLASKGDRVAMWESVELRPPFLDEDLVAYTNRLHPRWKLRRFTEKYILRKMAEKWVPREIARRPKKMFRAPLDSFHLVGPNRPKWIDQVLSPESLQEDRLLRRGCGAEVPGGDPEDAANPGEDEHRDGPVRCDGHAIMASLVREWRPCRHPLAIALSGCRIRKSGIASSGFLRLG